MKRVFFSLLFLIFVFSISYAQFKYENPIWVKNNTGSALTDAQILLVINTAIPIGNGWMQSDGKDIRFVSACNAVLYLNHWVEGYLNTDTTKIWVKIPTIAANDSTLIFMYYGNPGASNLSALSVFSGPHSATDSVVVASSNTVSNAQRGFRFQPNEDILVGYFGKRIPNATQRYLTLFDYTSQAILAQIQVDAGTIGVYNYNALPNPLWLKSGQQYVMELFNGSGDMYYYGTSSQIGQHLTYLDMRYCGSCTQNTFPTSVLTNFHYGTPDFLYYTKQNISPAPTARILLPADTVTPAAPTGLTSVCGTGQATLKWNKNTEFDVVRYDVYKNTSNSPGSATLAGSANQPDTTFIATGLTNGTPYYFWVKAVDRYCVPLASGFSTVTSCTPGGGGSGITNRSIVLPTPGVNTNYVAVPYNAGMTFGNNITIEAWYRIGGTTTANTVLNKGGISFDYQLGINASTSLPFFRAQGTVVTGTVPIPAGVWTHVAVTSNGTQAIFYVNGVAGSPVAGTLTAGTSTNEIRIGRGNADAGSGKIDEVRLWSVVRTPSEIASNMCVKWIPNSTTGLKAKWHFDSTYVDSVSGWNGTPMGTVTFDTANNCTTTGITNLQNEIPKEFSLYQNFPNPFNPNTTITFAIPKAAYVELVIYDITGKEIKTLVSDPYQAGTYKVTFNGYNLASGVYFYRITAGEFRDIKKMVLIK